MEKSNIALKNLSPKSNSQIRFIFFVFFILIGLGVSSILMSGGLKLTPEVFKDYVLSLGILGPVIYTAIFIVRPLFLIPSIALFIAGGLAFGPMLGPTYASIGSALGGAVGFWIARRMGHDFVMSKLKLGAGMLKETSFSFSVVFLLSLLPVMPVTAINYGAGLSNMSFRSYIIAFILGMTPRAFAYGFFGSTLMDVGSSKFRTASLILLLMIFTTIYVRLRSKQPKEEPFKFKGQIINLK